MSSDFDAMIIVRITCTVMGTVLNAGFYSRKREINENASFGVLG